MVLQRESILIGIIGLLAGLLIAGTTAVLSVNTTNRGMMQMMGMDTSHMKDDAGHMGMSMDDMAGDLSERTGDDFDENFIAMMIDHHQGAVEMAELAETRAKHSEIKQLSRDIITNQTSEINSMRQWQQNWNYSQERSSSSMHMR